MWISERVQSKIAWFVIGSLTLGLAAFIVFIVASV